MQLDRPLGFPEGGPWKKGEAEIDGGGVKQVELALELETMGRSKLAATFKELEKHRLIERRRLLLVHPGQGSPGTGPDGQMIQLARLGSHVHDDIPQAFATTKLADKHDHELGPAGKRPVFSALMIVFGKRVEFMSRKKCNNLSEDCVIVCHGSDLLDKVNVFRKFIITQRDSRAVIYLNSFTIL